MINLNFQVVFHVNQEHGKVAEKIRNLDPLFYLWRTIHCLVVPIVKPCVWLFLTIGHDSMLDGPVALSFSPRPTSDVLEKLAFWSGCALFSVCIYS